MRGTVISEWRRARSSVVRLLVLFAALAGLFAMHGMSDHGFSEHGMSGTGVGPGVSNAVPPASGHAASTGSPTHHMSAPIDALRPSVGVLVSAGESAATGALGLDGDLHGAMAMCLAILAAAAALILRRAWTSAHPLTSTLLDLRERVLGAHLRTPDPPDLHALSILRC